MYYYDYSYSIVSLRIMASERGIVGISTVSSEFEEAMKHQETPLIQNCAVQLQEYFSGKRTHFQVPLDLHGTPFQKKVWKELIQIPYGQTRTYQEIAEKVGNKNACRAIGMANHRNPVPLLVPCHRVIGKNGTLVGYALGLSIKEALLQLESAHISTKKE